MAGIVKWLRHRVVAPVYVGSNPTIRIRTILTDLLDGLNSNEEKQVREVDLYII